MRKKMKIIDTKSDLGFKKVFGEKPHLLISLLNNFLPLPHPIVSVEYMNPEMVPDRKNGKNSIVDVRCTDNHGQHFIVEMQVGKQGGFLKRVLLNLAKVYSRQLKKEDQFHMAQPVYSLNLLDHKLKKSKTAWYHHYAMTNRSVHEDYFEDLQIVLIELPKWRKLNTFDLEKPQDRWLMYFSDPNMFSILTKEERERFNEISEAIEVLETKNFTPEQIRGYELYIDNMRAYVTTMSEAKREGMEKGLKKGEKKGKAEGIIEGRNQIMDNTFAILDELIDKKLSIEQIAEKYNVNVQYVQQLKKYSS